MTGIPNETIFLFNDIFYLTNSFISSIMKLLNCLFSSFIKLANFSFNLLINLMNLSFSNLFKLPNSSFSYFINLSNLFKEQLPLVWWKFRRPDILVDCKHQLHKACSLFWLFKSEEYIRNFSQCFTTKQSKTIRKW